MGTLGREAFKAFPPSFHLSIEQQSVKFHLNNSQMRARRRENSRQLFQCPSKFVIQLLLTRLDR